MKVELKDNELEITFRYDERLVSFMKSLPARRYDARVKAWYVPILGAHAIVRTMDTMGFSVSQEASNAVNRSERMKEQIKELREAKTVEWNTRLPLFPYQKVGAKFLDIAGSGLLADSVGLGKTVQTLAIIEQMDKNSGKILIFVPSVLKYQWEGEIKRFIPQWKTQVIDGDAEERVKQWQNEADIYIANYELLLRDFERINAISWYLVVCDEATRISSIRTKTYRALIKIKAKRRIALTGTPISNRPDEIYGILNWCVPGVLGSYMRFIERYCYKNQWGGIMGYHGLEELHTRIQPYMIRRKKEDVSVELPEKISIDVPFRLSEKERELYQRVQKELLFEIQKEDISKLENPISIQSQIVKMLRLRQIANGMELVGDNTDSTKMEVLKGILKEVIAEERKIIVFTFFAEMADILERELHEYNPLKITGAVAHREKIVEDFNAKKEHSILIMTEAGAYGLNLQVVSVIIHYDLPWSLAKLHQREGRAHRIGASRNVLCYSLLAKGTIDMYIKKVVYAKQKISDTVLGDSAYVGADDIKNILTYDEQENI